MLQGVQCSREANMAQRTGLEPATPGVTGRYSNQLNYHCTVADDDDPNLSNWWVVTDSNRRHSACKADALPTELTTLTGNLLANQVASISSK